jgi:hypothetical protein
MPPSAEGLRGPSGAIPSKPRAVVLVEGLSDAAAVEVLARRRGTDLLASGVVVQAMGGATNITAHLEHFGPHGIDLRVGGLYDVGEERFFLRGAERAGLLTSAAPGDLPGLGFFACDPDLEHELIRALGPGRCVEVIRDAGDGAAWDLFQRQPYQRERPADAQVHRWLGSGSGRKIRYAAAFTESLEIDDVPRSLHRVLEHALDGAAPYRGDDVPIDRGGS